MTQLKSTLHMICGKMAAGKSTLSAQLGAKPGTSGYRRRFLDINFVQTGNA